MNEKLLAAAVAAARSGARVLRRYFGASRIQVETKGESDYVTTADHESEAAAVEEILRRFPDHSILGEEGGLREGSGEYQWLVDPLDGTTNFLHGLPIFAISVACRRGNELVVGAILDPVGDNLFTAVRGEGASWNRRSLAVSRRPTLHGAFLATGYPHQAVGALDLYLQIFRSVFLQARAIRRCGSAALDLAHTAAGIYDGFFEFRLAPWDIGAGALLIQEAGGRVTDLDGGGGYLESGNVIAGGPAVHRELLEVVSRHAQEADLQRLLPGPSALGASG